MKKFIPDLSIIILSYNTNQITKKCLDSVLQSLDKFNFRLEIIVIDNASTDGSVEMLKKYQNITPIFNKRNVGFGRGNNQGVAEARGKYLLFLNSDILVLNDAIDKLFTFYKQNEKTINFLGGKLLNENLSPQPSCGPFYSLQVAFVALFLRGDYWGLTRYSPNYLREVDWVSGACLLTRKDVFEKIGRFDENIFMYMEEIDLLYRAKRIGYRVYFYPQAQFIHLGFASSGSKSQPVIQVFRGLLYFYKLHHGKLSVILLKGMLQLKAYIGILIGRITKNRYLISTYEEASKILRMA